MNQLKPSYRAALAFAHDVLASAACWLLAFWLRFNLDIPEAFFPALASAVAASVSLHALVFWSLGLYRGTWRYASLPDLKRIAFACLIGALAVPALLALFRAGENVPRSTYILAPMLLAAIMSGSRIAYRALRERALYGDVQLTGEPVLVIGAGDITVNLLRELERSRQWRAVGILDDDPAWHGQLLLGVRVLGGLNDVGRWAEKLDALHAIVSLPAASAGVRRRAAELASAAGLTVLTVPSYDDLLSGKVTVSQDLYKTPGIFDQPLGSKSSNIYRSASFKHIKLLKVHNRVFNPFQRRKTALGKSALQWHLTTFETGLDAATGTRFLTFVAFSARLPVTRTLAATKTLHPMARTRTWT